MWVFRLCSWGSKVFVLVFTIILCREEWMLVQTKLMWKTVPSALDLSLKKSQHMCSLDKQCEKIRCVYIFWSNFKIQKKFFLVWGNSGYEGAGLFREFWECKLCGQSCEVAWSSQWATEGSVKPWAHFCYCCGSKWQSFEPKRIIPKPWALLEFTLLAFRLLWDPSPVSFWFLPFGVGITISCLSQHCIL